MKYLILSLLLIGCSSPKPKTHVKGDFDWVFRKVRNDKGAIILKEDGRQLKNACLSREEFKKWKAYQVKQCKGN